MDQDHLGLFSLFLKNAYDETIHIDVVKVKREKIVKRLDVLKDACKEKEYEKANFLIFDICDKVLNDPFSDEYDLKPVEIDMMVFSSAVLSISTKHYDRIKQIIKGLIMKYHNPVFYYILGISHFYDLNFQEAKKHLIFVMHLLSEHKNTKFPWPDTDVMITTISTDKIKEHALFFLDIIPSVEKVKKTTRTNHSRRKTSVEIIDISRRPDATTKLNLNIGNCIQHDIYPHVQTILADVIKFDKSRLPVSYQKVIPNTSEVKNTGPYEAKKKKPNTTDSTYSEKNEIKKNQTIQNEVKQELTTSEPATLEKTMTKKNNATQNDLKEKPTTSVPTILEKTTTKKNEGIQTQVVQTKCKQVQAVVKNSSIGVQTAEDTSQQKLITEQQEVINSLKLKLQQMTQKQKDMDAKLKNYNKAQKDSYELNSKNKLIAEQQEIISDLKVKLRESSAKHKELELKVNKINSKVSDLTKTNKSILAESNKQKETIAELRNYNQLLETKAKYNGKKHEDVKSVYKILVERYKNSYIVQIKFYENFKRRCESVLRVLNNISEYLTEITIPSKEECNLGIQEWYSAMISCIDILRSSEAYYIKYEKISEDSIDELLNMPPIMPIREPTDVILHNVPILIYTIKDFETMLQNINRQKKDNVLNGIKEFSESRNDFSGKTDYRKKCNFIHKSEQSSTSDVTKNSYPSYEKSKSNEACSDSKNRAHFPDENVCSKNIDTGGKKLRSLVSYLKQNIPHKAEADIIDALNLYRQSNNGTLSGMTLQSILYNVLTILDSPETAWSAVKSNCEILDNEELCPICIEGIHTKPKTVLPCRHAYHTECIREWLSVNRVCAVCRMYTVLDEDFPPLKNAV